MAVKASLTSPSTGAKKDNPVHRRKIVMNGKVDSNSDRRPKLSINQTAGMAKTKLTAETSDGNERVQFKSDFSGEKRLLQLTHLRILN